jgi:hypothetical protein
MNAYQFIEVLKQIAANWDREAIVQDSNWCRTQADNHRFLAVRIALALDVMQSPTATDFQRQCAKSQLHDLSY